MRDHFTGTGPQLTACRLPRRLGGPRKSDHLYAAHTGHKYLAQPRMKKGKVHAIGMYQEIRKGCQLGRFARSAKGNNPPISLTCRSGSLPEKVLPRPPSRVESAPQSRSDEPPGRYYSCWNLSPVYLRSRAQQSSSEAVLTSCRVNRVRSECGAFNRPGAAPCAARQSSGLIGFVPVIPTGGGELPDERRLLMTCQGFRSKDRLRSRAPARIFADPPCRWPARRPGPVGDKARRRPGDGRVRAGQLP